MTFNMGGIKRAERYRISEARKNGISERSAKSNKTRSPKVCRLHRQTGNIQKGKAF